MAFSADTSGLPRREEKLPGCGLEKGRTRLCVGGMPPCSRVWTVGGGGWSGVGMGTGPPRLEKLRSCRDVNVRAGSEGGGSTPGPDGGSHGPGVRFLSAGT